MSQINAFPIATRTVDFQKIIDAEGFSQDAEAARDLALTYRDAAQGFASSASASASSASASESSAETARTQAELAATAAGATLYDSTASGLSDTTDGDVFLVATEPGVQIYRNDTGSATFLGWLGEVLFDDAPAFFDYPGTFAAGTYVRTRAEGFAYNAVDTATATTVANVGGQAFEVLDLTQAAAWGLSGDGQIDSFGPAYDVSGPDDQPSLNDAIDAAILGLSGKLTLPYGKYYMADDLVMGRPANVPDTFSTLYRQFSFLGDGKSSSWAWMGEAQKATGTMLIFAPGKNLFFPNGRVGYRISNMSIVGSASGEALVNDLSSDFGGFMHDHGGLQNCLIMNYHTSAPAAGTWAIRTNALYGSAAEKLDIEGRPVAAQAWRDATIAIDNLFFGGGWIVTRKGQGSGGFPPQTNFRGFDLAFSCGLSAAAWAASSQNTVDKIVMPSDTQIHYCNRGIFFGAGLERLELKDCFSEAITQHFLKMSGQDNRFLLVEGGATSTANRTGPTGTERIRDGAFVIGDAFGSENLWGYAEFKKHYFGFVTQAGVVTYNGPNSGEIVIDKCSGNYNGGALVVIDAASTGKTPDILIKDWLGPKEGLDDFITSRFVATANLSTDYTAHTNYVDARHLARLENCPGFDDNIIISGDLDLTTRKYIPFQVAFNTLDASRVVTLGNLSRLGDAMHYEKRFAANQVSFVVPSTIKLIDGSGTEHSDTTVGVSAAGYYEATRIADGVWRTTAILA